MSLDLGALLEPLGVAIQACKRAQLAPRATVLVFGAGAVGLLVAAMARISGAATVVIADIDQGRVEFAVQNHFAHRNFVVPVKRGATIEEQLAIARETAAEIGKIEKDGGGGEIGEVDAVFECTGVLSCVQASIFVSSPIFMTYAGADDVGNASRRSSLADWHGNTNSNPSHLRCCFARGRYQRRL